MEGTGVLVEGYWCCVSHSKVKPDNLKQRGQRGLREAQGGTARGEEDEKAQKALEECRCGEKGHMIAICPKVRY